MLFSVFLSVSRIFWILFARLSGERIFVVTARMFSNPDRLVGRSSDIYLLALGAALLGDDFFTAGFFTAGFFTGAFLAAGLGGPPLTSFI